MGRADGRAGRPAPDHRRSCRPAAAVLLDLYVIAGEAPDADPERSAEKIRAMLGRLPERLARVAVAVRRPRGDERSAWFTFAAASGPAAGGGPHAARAAPDGRRAAGAVAAGRLRADPAAVADRRAPVPRRRPQRARRPAADRAVRRPRPDRAARRRTGRIRALPQLEHVLDSCLDAHARRPRRRPRGRARWTGTGCCSTSGRWSTCRSTSSTRWSACSPRARWGWAWSRCWCSSATPRNRASEPTEYLLRMSRPPGAGLTVRVTEPPTHPLRELDGVRAEGDPGPPARRGLPVRAGADAAAQPGPRRRASACSPSTTSDRIGAPVVVDRPAGGKHRQHRARHGHHADAALPGGHDPGRADRRPDQGARRARRAGVPRGCWPRSSWPGGWTRRSSGSRCRPAPRSPWTPAPRTWTGSPGCCAGSSSSPRTAARSTSWSPGINVGAQPYWNAEATMLMHTKGILVMTPDSAMVLTGKQCARLLRRRLAPRTTSASAATTGSWARTGRPSTGRRTCPARWTCCSPTTRTPTVRPASGSRGRRRPPTRSTATSPTPRTPARAATSPRVGEIFTANPERKKPFDIRSVLRAVADSDHPTLERWVDMIDADGVVVLDAHLGGQPVALIGIESRPLPRRGLLPVDGPTTFTAGTLFPKSSKKTARGDQRGQRQPPAGDPGQPLRLRRLPRVAAPGCSWSTAPRSAGRSSTSTARSCSAWSRATTAVRSWCSPGR